MITISLQNSLPIDLSLKIASFLEVSDLCSLGSCSRFWEELCRSDCVWKALYTERWPAIALHQDSMGWKEMYVSKHREMVVNAAFIMNFVEQRLAFDSIEIAYHLKAVKYLHSMKFEFKDIQMMFLKPSVDVLVNWIGLDYCISRLDVPAGVLVEALQKRRISDREICVKWWKLGRWLHGFRLRDEFCSRTVTLKNLAMAKEDEVLRVVHRGAVHEVLRVMICSPKPDYTPWYCS